MKSSWFLYLGLLFIILSSCTKPVRNRFVYFFSTTPTDISYGLVFDVSSGTKEIYPSEGGGRSGHSILANGDFHIDINSNTPDTIFLTKFETFGESHVIGYVLELFDVKIHEKNNLVFEEDSFFKTSISSLNIHVQENEGKLIKVLLELNTDSSIQKDSTGSYTFTPVFKASLMK